MYLSGHILLNYGIIQYFKKVKDDYRKWGGIMSGDTIHYEGRCKRCSWGYWALTVYRDSGLVDCEATNDHNEDTCSNNLVPFW